jgi:phage recombination protein Bet
MNAITKIEPAALPAMTEQEILDVLRNSLYPGAKDESIKMVRAYCRAANLDPMQKPVHIVPMSVSTGRKDNNGYDIKETRDVIMPGIGLYRTQAARSGEYGGITEPEFGEDVTDSFDDVQITYPRWCKVTVKRFLNGHIVEFSAKEFWKENYATKSSKSIAPNAMWKRRPYAQIAKCAEAQALRKAFPEIGSQPTADEMEGKEYGETIDHATGEITVKKALPPEYGAAKFAENKASWKALIESGRKTADAIIAQVSTKGALTEEQKNEIRSWEPVQGDEE